MMTEGICWCLPFFFMQQRECTLLSISIERYFRRGFTLPDGSVNRFIHSFTPLYAAKPVSCLDDSRNLHVVPCVRLCYG